MTIHIDSCAAGETIVVNTLSNVYELIVLRDAEAAVLVRGGRHFTEFSRVLFLGSMAEGGPLHPRTIEIGLRMQFICGDRLVTTSAVQSLSRRPVSTVSTDCGRRATTQCRRPTFAAEDRLRMASERQAAMPVPERLGADADVAVGREAAARAKSHLETIEREIQKAHGALEQVGGAVARERLRDVIEAYELAERHEREIEADRIVETAAGADEGG